jgi:predicted lactoylglutathione lyase
MKILIVFLAKKNQDCHKEKKMVVIWKESIMYILKKNEKYHNFKIFIKEKNKKNPHIN